MTYCQRVRVYVEFNVPLWSFSISKSLSNKIEKLQKAAVFLMLPLLGSFPNSDYSIIEMMGLELLKQRRVTLCHTFARKMYQHPEHKKSFTSYEGRSTRAGRKVIVPQARTKRYSNSSIPSLARIINSQ